MSKFYVIVAVLQMIELISNQINKLRAIHFTRLRRTSIGNSSERVNKFNNENIDANYSHKVVLKYPKRDRKHPIIFFPYLQL